MSLGVVSIIIAAGALIVSMLSLNYARIIKTTDLRIQARNARAKLDEALRLLKNSHSKALSARKSLNATRGLLDSGATQKYIETWEQRNQKIGELVSESDKITVSSNISDQKRLEEIIVNIHNIKTQIETIQKQYDNDEIYNEKEIDQMRKDRRANTRHQS